MRINYNPFWSEESQLANLRRINDQQEEKLENLELTQKKQKEEITKLLRKFGAEGEKRMGDLCRPTSAKLKIVQNNRELISSTQTKTPPIEELRSSEASVSLRRADGFTARDLNNAGHPLSELKKAGFTARDLKNAGHPLSELKKAGFTAGELRNAGFMKHHLDAAGFSPQQLIDAGFTSPIMSELVPPSYVDPHHSLSIGSRALRNFQPSSALGSVLGTAPPMPLSTEITPKSDSSKLNNEPRVQGPSQGLSLSL